MVHGDKPLEQSEPAARDDATSRLIALAVLLGCFGLSSWVFSLAPAGF
jgi:hypothetical protein